MYSRIFLSTTLLTLTRIFYSQWLSLYQHLFTPGVGPGLSPAPKGAMRQKNSCQSLPTAHPLLRPTWRLGACLLGEYVNCYNVICYPCVYTSYTSYATLSNCINGNIPESLVRIFSKKTCTSLQEIVHNKNTSDKWDIPWYTARKRSFKMFIY